MPKDPKQVILDTPITVEEIRSVFNDLMADPEGEEKEEVNRDIEYVLSDIIKTCEAERILTLGKVFTILSEKHNAPEMQGIIKPGIIFGIIIALATEKGLEKQIKASGILRGFFPDDPGMPPRN